MTKGKSDKGKARDRVKKTKKDEEHKKVVRDSFTMPEVDYLRIGELKQRCLEHGINAKKSELLRAGLQVLSGLNNEQLQAAIKELEPVKTGRPTKS